MNWTNSVALIAASGRRGPEIAAGDEERVFESSFALRGPGRPGGGLGLSPRRRFPLPAEGPRRVAQGDLSSDRETISSSFRATMWRFAYAGWDQFTAPNSRRFPGLVVGLMRVARLIS